MLYAKTCAHDWCGGFHRQGQKPGAGEHSCLLLSGWCAAFLCGDLSALGAQFPFCPPWPSPRVVGGHQSLLLSLWLSLALWLWSIFYLVHTAVGDQDRSGPPRDPGSLVLHPFLSSPLLSSLVGSQVLSLLLRCLPLCTECIHRQSCLPGLL